MRRRQQRQPPFVQVFQESGKVVVQANRLTLSELRIWLYMVFCCEWGNWVSVSHREVGEALQMDRAHVSRCVQVLVNEGMLFRERPLTGRQWRYRLPTFYVHYGPLEDLPWKRPRDYARQLAQQRAGLHAASSRKPAASVSTRTD